MQSKHKLNPFDVRRGLTFVELTCALCVCLGLVQQVAHGLPVLPPEQPVQGPPRPLLVGRHLLQCRQHGQLELLT